MKNALYLLLFATVFIACDQQKKTIVDAASEDETTVLSAEDAKANEEVEKKVEKVEEEVAEVTKAKTLTWHTDLNVAHSESEKTKKPIFGFFTGSDWCGWCIKLQKEVFAKQAFIDWANENVVLLELDFPKRTAQSNELKLQNRNLQRALGVTGYPTVWLFTSKKTDAGGYNITRGGKLGYPSGAVKGKEEVKFLATANQILATMSL